jgi:glycosyltransferase involved in cell wall biosynthesis
VPDSISTDRARECAHDASPPAGRDAISVVIPFYNRAAFSERLFRSIIGQTLRPAAVFIVDNGSRPEELEACSRIAKSLDWAGIETCFLQTTRQGNANVARNLGMETARTRYVAFVDSDDWWEPEHLERSLAQLQGTGRAAVYAGAIIHRSEVHVDRSRDVNTCTSPFELLLSGASAQTSSYLVDLRLLGGSIRWDEALRRHQDFDFFLQIHYRTPGWAFLSTPCTHVDWDRGGAGTAIDDRSLVRFRRKWKSLIPQVAVRHYAYLQLLRCHEMQRDALYRKYFRRLYLDASQGRLTARLRSLPCYMGLKGALHRHGVVRRLLALRRAFSRP